MCKCKLCDAVVDFKGISHIIPHFLLQTVINADGIKGRDRELSIAIGDSFISEYFGRNVPVEKIEKYMGRGLTEEEISTLTHHYGEHDIFCKNCEERLSVIEHYYSNLKFSEDYKSKKTNVTMSLLFWISVIWRISISQGTTFKFTAKEEKKFRSILNRCLDRDINKVPIKITENIDSLKNFAYMLLYFNVEDKDASTFYHPHPTHRMPYSFLIHNYILLFYFKKSHIGNIQQDLWGFEKIMDQKAINTIPGNLENIIPIPEDVYKKSIHHFGELYASIFLQNIVDELKQLHKELFGFDCPEIVMAKTITQIIEKADVHLGGQYTRQNQIHTFVETISQYQHLYTGIKPLN